MSARELSPSARDSLLGYPRTSDGRRLVTLRGWRAAAAFSERDARAWHLVYWRAIRFRIAHPIRGNPRRETA